MCLLMDDRRTLILPAKAAVIIAALGGAAGFAYLLGNGNSVSKAAVISLCGAAALAGMLVLGSGKCMERMQKLLTTAPPLISAIILALWGLYAAYAAGTATARRESLVGMALYLALPFLLLTGSRGASKSTWRDAAAILWLWLTIELGIVRQLLSTSPSSGADFRYGFAQGLAIDTGIIAFGAWRRFPGIGYRFKIDRRVVIAGLASFLIFAAIAIPLGFAIDFIAYRFTLRKLLFGPALFVGVFLFTAMPEEFLFRGLIQNWFERLTARPGLSLALASIVFGASHLNNGPPLPNYKYFLMATIAGLFYGFAWRRTGSLMASAITHALVDTVWSVYFR
jgi:membrane protease YdiL (CAAX protease family)